jgi:hypothetical protein
MVLNGVMIVVKGAGGCFFMPMNGVPIAFGDRLSAATTSCNDSSARHPDIHVI